VTWQSVLIAGITLAALAMIAPVAMAAGSDTKSPSDPAPPFFTEHCQKCHSGAKPKGDFRIDSLTQDFADKNNRLKWLDVLEKVKSGEMPPEDKPRPSAQDVKNLVAWISAQTGAAEIARAAGQGRVVLRRLNRAEYANTVRDLLSVEVDLADLLPPDTSTSGFDNSAEAMHTSSYLMETYLEAADRVLDEAIANKPRPYQIHKKFDLREERSVKPTGSVYRHTDDGVAIFASWESANIRVTMFNFRSHVRGKYRVRISAYGMQTDKPVNFRVTAGTLKEVTEERLVDYFAVPPNKPTVIEFTEQLEPDNRIRIIAEGLPALPPAVQKIGADKYTGPGLVIQWVDIEGPLLESWPPRSHQLIFGDLKQANVPRGDDAKRMEVVSQQPLVDADRILREFARRAFRRTVTDEDIKPFMARVKAKLEQKYTFEQAVRVGLKGILVSPEFLFLREKTGPAGETKRRLDDFALASRLSYFLWSSMPDEELLALAERGMLTGRGGEGERGRKDSKSSLSPSPAPPLSPSSILRQQVERMLRDPKAKAFTDNFAGQWLGLRAIDATTPDRMLYPEYDDILKVAMVKETVLFFDEVLKNDLSLTSFVSSDFTFLNGRLAKHYGIPGVEGTDLRKVSLPPESHRGGVLTMGAVMKVTANGTTTSPILRGAWVLDRILGTPPPKPPADVEAVEPDIRGATTIRNQLAKHRANGQCASCHSKIDPPGFALENFDVIGGWRDNYRSIGKGDPVNLNGRRVRYLNGPRVDAGDVLPDGRRFANIDEYKQLLLADKDQLARALAEKLLTYATGAAPTTGDQPEIEKIVRNIRDKKYGFRSLIHEIVESPVFQSK
jgi:mono/diheme cytochrome c family protein